MKTDPLRVFARPPAPARRSRLVTSVLAGLALAACNATTAQRTGSIPRDLQDRISEAIYPPLRQTVGEYAIFADSLPLPVEGYAIVGNLRGTGSGDMDPKIREMLQDELIKSGVGLYSTGTQDISPEDILKSNQIAAVEVRGLIPPLARQGTTFDLVVNALPNSQATSLENGLLWPADLKIIGLTTEEIDTKPIALGRGPTFISASLTSAESGGSIPDGGKTLRIARIMGGGVCTEDRPIRLQLYRPSFLITSAIERAINARFPGRDKYAVAEDNSIVDLTVPPEYITKPQDFIDIVMHMYLVQETPGFTEKKAAELINCLKDPKAPCREISLALQGLGRAVLQDCLQPQYTAADPTVRFWCARAGANLEDAGGMDILEEMARDPKSPFKRLALLEMVEASRGRETVRASAILADLFKSPDSLDRIAGYEGLVLLRSRAMTSYSVGGHSAPNFILDVVSSDGPPLIYITQCEWPRIALIGKFPPLPPGSFYISPDNALTLSVPSPTNAADGVSPSPAPAGPATQPQAGGATVLWRSYYGRQVTLNVPITIPELISRLAWTPDPTVKGSDTETTFVGLNYQRVADMLATMCRERMIDAKIIIQKAPESIRTPADIMTGARPEGGATLPATQPAAGHHGSMHDRN